jgi:hypothetical protein
MNSFLQAMNEKIEQVIVNNSQLVVGDKWPTLFHVLIEHIESYKALISEWNEKNILEDYTTKDKNTVLPVYPDKFDTCVEKLYLGLKKRQARLQELRWQNYVPWWEFTPTLGCDPDPQVK